MPLRVDTSHTFKRQWTLLRLIPRWPQTCTVGTLAEHLAGAGYPTTHRTIERDLQAAFHDLPLHVDDSRKPFRWCWEKNANFEFAPRPRLWWMKLRNPDSTTSQSRGPPGPLSRTAPKRLNGARNSRFDRMKVQDEYRALCP